MGRKRKRRRQSHGSAWHWKQTDCWYYTMPGTKKKKQEKPDERVAKPITPALRRLESLAYGRRYVEAVEVLLDILRDLDSAGGDFAYWCTITPDSYRLAETDPAAVYGPFGQRFVRASAMRTTGP